jgi:hypothetical protein
LLLLAIFLGWLGIHRFYAGGQTNMYFGIGWLLGVLVVLPVISSITCGVGLVLYIIPAICWIIDIILAAIGNIKDENGNPI